MVDLVITASQVAPGSNAVITPGTAGATITQGQALYLDPATNTWKLAIADATASHTGTVGIALNAASSGQPINVQTGGDIILGAGAAPAIGTAYMASINAGGIAPAAAAGAGNFSALLGVGLGPNGAPTTLRLACKGNDGTNHA